MNEPLLEVLLADQILDLVKSNPDVGLGGARGDTATVAMLGAYVRAWRRLKRIRDEVAAGAGAEASILGRTLLSMIARAIWLDLPEDSEDRRRRFRSWLRRQIEDEIAEAEGRQAIRLPVAPDEIADLQRRLAEVADADAFPTDKQLLTKELPLSVHYESLYRTGSGFAHFTLRHAVDEIRRSAADGIDLTVEEARLRARSRCAVGCDLDVRILP